VHVLFIECICFQPDAHEVNAAETMQSLHQHESSKVYLYTMIVEKRMPAPAPQPSGLFLVLLGTLGLRCTTELLAAVLALLA
jgi:hypothetical protein